jgi:hypothetical protein
MRRPFQRPIRILAVACAFAGGYLTAIVTQPAPAEAQMGEMMKKATEAASESGGPLGTVAKLGTTIEGLQKNVDELQKDIDTLKEIESALGG